MNFYSLYGSGSEYSLNILEINSTKILFLRNFPQDKILYYLPQSDINEDKDITTDELKKKIKIDEETRLFKTISSTMGHMEIEGDEFSKNNPYYIKVKEKYYIRGAIKFDLTFLNNIDQNSIDFILLTSIDDLFLLPFLFSQKKMKAKVYATVPVAQIGQYVLQEYCKLVQNRNRNIDQGFKAYPKGNNSFQYYPQDFYFMESEFLDLFETQYDLEINQWVDIFTYEDIQTSFSKITTMSFGQQLKLEGVDILIEPVSSGYSIGSCIWILEHHSNKIAVCNNASKHSFRHTLNLDHSTKLKDCLDFLFVTPFMNSSKDYGNFIKQTNASQLCEAYLIKFVQLTQELLQQKQNIVIPIRDGSVILDLLDILEKKISAFIRHLYIICESALPYIQFGNSNVEFLNEKLQKKIFCENPSNPFSAYEFFVKNQNINILPDFIAFQQSSKSQSLQSLILTKTPSIFFVVDSTLRLGNTIQLLKLIDESVPRQEEFSSSILLVDALMQNPNILAPVIGLYRNQIFYAPLDNRLHVQEFCEYVKHLNPKNLIYPRKYQDIQIFLEQQREASGQRILTSIYGSDEAISLNLYLNDEQALTIHKNELKNIKFQKFERISFLPQLGTIRGILNIETGIVQTRISTNQIDLEEKLSEESKMIILRCKNQIQRNQSFTNLQNSLIQEMNNLGYQSSSTNITNDGIKLIFKSTNEVAHIDHDKERTLVYSSNKEHTVILINHIKSKINVIELK